MNSEEAMNLKPGDVVWVNPAHEEAPSWQTTVVAVHDQRDQYTEPSMRTVRVEVEAPVSRYTPNGTQTVDRRYVSGPVHDRAR